MFEMLLVLEDLQFIIKSIDAPAIFRWTSKPPVCAEGIIPPFFLIDESFHIDGVAPPVAKIVHIGKLHFSPCGYNIELNLFGILAAFEIQLRIWFADLITPVHLKFIQVCIPPSHTDLNSVVQVVECCCYRDENFSPDDGPGSVQNDFDGYDLFHSIKP